MARAVPGSFFPHGCDAAAHRTPSDDTCEGFVAAAELEALRWALGRQVSFQ
jgi:hypothetical protein